MKRFRSEGVKGQGELKGKRSKRLVAAEESDPASESNPFIIEPDNVIKLLKLVESVSQLKELRLMSQTWDELILKDLEQRAINRKLKAVDFRWINTTTSEAEDNFAQFMEDTSAIRRFFNSFKFNFPQSFPIINNQIGFFSLYPVTFVDLAIPGYFAYQAQILVLFEKFMKTEIWRNFKEIIISFIYPHENDMSYGLPDSSIFVPYSGPTNIQRRLQKLDFTTFSPDILSLFKSDFATGEYTNLTSMGIEDLRSGDLNFAGLDASKLTRLEIDTIGDGYANALRFTLGLLNLAGSGMTLKNFGMSTNLTPHWMRLDLIPEFLETLPLIFSNLTQFLNSQSSTLETLFFGFNCLLEGPVEDLENAEVWAKIHLPIFKVLHSLQLKVDLKIIEAEGLRRTHSQLFGMTQNLAIHFPKLVNLTLYSESSLTALRVNPAQDEAGQLQLERLEIPYIYDLTSFIGVIGSVKELSCPGDLLCLQILPWAESLRQLSIHDAYLRVKQKEPFKMNHFKKLETLFIIYSEIRSDRWTPVRTRSGTLPKVDHLRCFKEAAELPLTSITFMGPEMPEVLKEKFIKYFTFPVEFKLNLFE